MGGEEGDEEAQRRRNDGEARSLRPVPYAPVKEVLCAAVNYGSMFARQGPDGMAMNRVDAVVVVTCIPEFARTMPAFARIGSLCRPQHQ